jgi:hypothetical protein
MSMTFRKAARRSPIPRDVAARQARLLRATQAARFTAEATRDFLNSEHPDLAGRPLDVALGSDMGLLEVEKLICLEVRRRADAG